MDFMNMTEACEVYLVLKLSNSSWEMSERIWWLVLTPQALCRSFTLTYFQNMIT